MTEDKRRPDLDQPAWEAWERADGAIVMVPFSIYTAPAGEKFPPLSPYNRGQPQS